MKLTVAKVDGACPECGAAVKGGQTTIALVGRKWRCVTCAGRKEMATPSYGDTMRVALKTKNKGIKHETYGCRKCSEPIKAG